MQPDDLRAAIREYGTLRPDGPINVHVNPADADEVRTDGAAVLDEFDAELVEDPTVDPGTLEVTRA